MKRAVLGLWLILAGSGGRCLAQGVACPDPALESMPARDFTPVCPIKPEPCSSQIWSSADYLLWWVRGEPTPPLVVTGSPADPFPGALDQPGTKILYGNDDVGFGTFSGLRLDLGGWLDGNHSLGLEAGGFLLEQRAARFSAQGDANGQPFLATPFVNALSGNDNVYFISQNFANPALSAHLTGSVEAATTTRLWSWEAQGVANLARSSNYTVDAILGFRETSLREDLSYFTTVTNLTPGGASLFLTNPVPPGSTVTTFDRFATSNLFNGGQTGLRFSRSWGIFSLEGSGKVALGDMHETVSIAGSTTTTAPFPVTQAVGGIFAQSSNIGTYHRDVFAVIPEIGVNACVQLTSNIKARVGYTWLYLSSVARPGDQIDPVLNINRVPIDAAFGTPGGPNRPAFETHGTSFWAQGVNFGLEIGF